MHMSISTTCDVCEHVMSREEEATLVTFTGHEHEGRVLCLDCMAKVIDETVVS